MHVFLYMLPQELVWKNPRRTYTGRQATSNDTIVDSKDITPVQRTGKTWKKRSGVLLDHEWNRVNAVKPMAYLFLDNTRYVGSTSVVRLGRNIILFYFLLSSLPLTISKRNTSSPSSARIFTCLGHRLEGRVLHKGAWIATSPRYPFRGPEL